MPPIDLPEPFTDGVVAIREWRREDVIDLIREVQDPEVEQWTAIPHPYGRREANAFLRACGRQQAMGMGAELAVTDAARGTILGGVGLRLSIANSNAEVGYWVAASKRGRGLAPRAVRLMSGWAFRDLGVQRIELLTHVDNFASQRVAEKAGFTREGVLRSAREIKGVRTDFVIFSLLPGDVSES